LLDDEKGLKLVASAEIVSRNKAGSGSFFKKPLPRQPTNAIPSCSFLRM
jgi:hypothetical protein